MTSQNTSGVRFRYASDQSFLIEFDDPARIVRFVRWFEMNSLRGLRNTHPAYRSVLVVFDPVQRTHDELQIELTNALAHLADIALPEPRLIEIPVQYGGSHGPDLEDVAAFHGISQERVIELHSEAVYRVSFLGFVPGFAYLSGLREEIATPRLVVPRTHVPAGSVGIAGSQSGVYPFVTPGGWRLIGRTEAKMFETNREQMSLLEIGDRVRFIPV